MLSQITATLTEIAKIERPSVLTGRRMTLLLVPK
jgi:translation initiation factor IF-3